MLKFFGAGKADHPMADLKEARKLLDELAPNDAFKALDELSDWHDSVRSAEGFKPEYRAQLTQLIDEAAQLHVRKLSRDYLASPSLSKFQESRLWSAIHAYYKQAALSYAACIDLYATGAKGADSLKNALPLLTVRALRALAAQMKWQTLRYGPFEDSLWGVVAKIYALAETKKYARTKVSVYPAIPGESSAEQEFLRAVMLAASSPDGLLPLEIEIAERLIAHFSASFTLVLAQQPDIAYWIDLATSMPPLRLARPPQHAPTLRFFAAGKASEELEQLIKTVKATGAVPSSVGLGGTYEPKVILDVLDHLYLYWSTKPPERKHPRHNVKTRLAVTHGFEGVMGVLDPSSTLNFDDAAESWIVDNVSAGGFGVTIPQVKGDWLKIGTLLGLQPEGGQNWVIGIVRRLNRDSAQKASIGVQTIARAAAPVKLRLQSGSMGLSTDAETGILLDPAAAVGAPEARLVLKAGAMVEGQNLQYEDKGATFLLLPAGTQDKGVDYELVRFRQMKRDTGE